MAGDFQIGSSIYLDGEREFKQAVTNINRSLNVLSSEMRMVTAQFSGNANSMEALRAKTETYNRQIDEQKNKVETLKSALESARREYGENSREVQSWQIQLNNAEARLSNLEQGLQNTTAAMHNLPFEQAQAKLDSLASGFDNAAKKIAPFSLAAGGALVGMGKAAIDFESAFAGVLKTVDATEPELAALKTGIMEMSKEVPASANAISGVAEAAGQLGIKTENILGFTRTMIDLGEATNLTSDEAATMFAQFANITGMDQSQFSNLGSAIVDLGNNFATTEADIANMAMRLAGAGTQIGLTQSEILGISAALSSVGIEADAGGTAFSKVFSQMQVAVETGSESLTDFANVAGLSADEFAEKFRTAPAEAIQAFVGGLAAVSENGDSAIVTLENMGITEVRLRDALLRSAGASDMFSSAIETSNKAFGENTALSTEAEKRYGTTASQIAIMKNEIISLAVDMGEQLLPVIKDMIEGIKSVVDWFTGLDESQQKNLITALALTAGLTPMLKLLSGISSAASIVIGVTQGVSAAVNGVALAENASTASLIANKIALGASTIATQISTAAQWLWNAALNANPIGIVILAIGALVAAFVILYNNSETFRTFILGVWEAIKTAFSDAVTFIKTVPGEIVNLFGVLVDFFKGLPGKIWQELLNSIANIKQWGEDIKSWAEGALPDVIAKIVSFFSELPDKMLDVGKNIVTGIWDGISGAAGWLKDQVAGFVDGIVSAFTGKDGIDAHSPSRLFAKFGGWMAQGLGEGFTSSMSGIAEDMESVIPTNFDSRIQYAVKQTTEPTTTQAIEGAVNGLATIMGSQQASGGTYIINVVLPNGTKLAEVVFDPLRNIVKQRGVSLG